jgi:hypothetical protein
MPQAEVRASLGQADDVWWWQLVASAGDRQIAALQSDTPLDESPFTVPGQRLCQRPKSNEEGLLGAA